MTSRLTAQGKLSNHNLETYSICLNMIILNHNVILENYCHIALTIIHMLHQKKFFFYPEGFGLVSLTNFDFEDYSSIFNLCCSVEPIKEGCFYEKIKFLLNLTH